MDNLIAFDLREWRRIMKLSQAGAAKALGCSRSAFIRWESDKKMPRYIVLACRTYSYGLPL